MYKRFYHPDPDTHQWILDPEEVLKVLNIQLKKHNLAIKIIPLAGYAPLPTRTAWAIFEDEDVPEDLEKFVCDNDAHYSGGKIFPEKFRKKYRTRSINVDQFSSFPEMLRIIDGQLEQCKFTTKRGIIESLHLEMNSNRERWRIEKW